MILFNHEQRTFRERGADRRYSEKTNYPRYKELGGIINEKDYDSAIERMKNVTAPDKTHALQAEGMARFAGIELHSTEDTIDPRVILYGILRSDVQPKGIKYHHSQMTDQKIFVEALRMLEDVESIEKMVKAHPHISFKYGEETAP